MSDRIKAFWLGLFILACVALLAWLLLFLRPSVGDDKQILRVRFSNIEKIAIGSRVTYGGKAVGEVREINEVFDARNLPTDVNDVPYLFELVLRVDSKVRIYDCDEILFSTSGLLGEKTIAIIPKGPTAACPHPKEITTNVLYARSTDQLQQAVDKLLHVANTTDETMIVISKFIRENNEDFRKTMQSLQAASSGVVDLTSHTQNLVTTVMHPQGSFGKLIHSDAFYLKLMNTMGHFDQLVSTMNRYGLLFQFSGSWQKERRYRASFQRNLCTPEAVYNYFDCELTALAGAVDRLNEAKEQARCANIDIDLSCLLDKINELTDKIRDLENY
jgi:phospholipid/cholesterol/gamma-HCH transport system substrate-binding protein